MRRAAPAVLVSCLLAAAARRAGANGAFPDSQAVITPADRPQQLILATNFGLVLSDDDGQSWQWSCERDTNAYGILYQQGPAPRHRLFTVANDGLVFSDDGSCGWTAAAGTVAGLLMTDVFPDPTDADHVLAVGYDGSVFRIFPSVDGGVTFGAPLYTAAAGDGIGGVEIARSDPRVIYAAMTTAATTTPKLARSRDGGATWAITDLGAVAGAGAARIVAVDAQDANVVLLRLMGADGETLALTRDGGATVTPSLTIAGQLTAYVALPGGTRLVGALVDSSTTAALFRSNDGGATFQPVANPPHIRALSQRGGSVYAATDNFGDGYALGASTDEGVTWRPVMRYEQIQSILGCLRADPQCQNTCQLLAGQGTGSPAMIWDAAVCSANPPEPPLPEPPVKGGGCGCEVAANSDPVLVVVLVVVLVLGSRRRSSTTTRTRTTTTTRTRARAG